MQFQVRRTLNNNLTYVRQNYVKCYYYYGKNGHKAVNCKSKNYKNNNKNDRNYIINEENKKICLDKLEFDDRIRDRTVRINIDSGARRNFVSEKIVKDNERVKLNKSFKVQTANGEFVEIFDKAILNVSFDQIYGQTFRIEAMIMDMLCEINLGL